MVLLSADISFSKSFFLFFFSYFLLVISVECQEVWIQIMPISRTCLQGYQQATLVSKEFMTKIQAN